jgi:methionyl-tRNA formyltransferase
LTAIRIGYFGDGPWSHLAFELLVADPEVSIAFVCARADMPDETLRALARNHGVDFLTHAKINSDEFLAITDRYGCDLFVSMSFNQIFRTRLSERPRLRTINCHAGKLPFYRGRNILNWALINDEPEFGITVHYVDEGIDTGDILAQRVFPITDSDDYSTLLARAYSGCSELLYETVGLLRDGQLTPLSQASVHPTGFYCTARRNGDERLDWNQSSRAVFNFVRAICRPGPEARTFCGDDEIFINRVECVPSAPVYGGIPGAVVGASDGAIFVKTRDSFVRVVEWSGRDRLRVGDRLS